MTIDRIDLINIYCSDTCCCCYCCCEIPDHRVVPTVGTSLVSLILHVVSILYGDCNMCFLYECSYAAFGFLLSYHLIIVSLLLLKVTSVYYHWVPSFVSLSSLHYLLYCSLYCCLLVISSCSCYWIISFVPCGVIPCQITQCPKRLRPRF